MKLCKLCTSTRTDERKRMGLLERIQEENRRLGIVPQAGAQHSKHLGCEECGTTIDPMREGWTGRYNEAGQAVYMHVGCPDDEW